MRFTQPGPTLYNAGQKEWTLGCVNPSSWLPLAAEREFTQPRVHSFAQPCSLLPPLLFQGVRQDLSSAKKALAKEVRKFPSTYSKEIKKKEGGKKIATAKKGRKGIPGPPSNIAKRKKIVKTILD